MPELPEEVEAVVCDAGDLAEGEMRTTLDIEMMATFDVIPYTI